MCVEAPLLEILELWSMAEGGGKIETTGSREAEGESKDGTC